MAINPTAKRIGSQAQRRSEQAGGAGGGWRNRRCVDILGGTSTHRIPSTLATEAASETVAACARQGYHETAVVLDADGATIAAVRGDGAGIHTIDSDQIKHTPAYRLRATPWPWLERAKRRRFDRAAR